MTLDAGRLKPDDIVGSLSVGCASSSGLFLSLESAKEK
jgi:hypothetical protein